MRMGYLSDMSQGGPQGIVERGGVGEREKNANGYTARLNFSPSPTLPLAPRVVKNKKSRRSINL
jgi:hypothetical protein